MNEDDAAFFPFFLLFLDVVAPQVSSSRGVAEGSSRGASGATASKMSKEDAYECQVYEVGNGFKASCGRSGAKMKCGILAQKAQNALCRTKWQMFEGVHCKWMTVVNLSYEERTWRCIAPRYQVPAIFRRCTGIILSGRA